MDKNEVLYQLTAEDFQNIAVENLYRELSDEEIQMVADWVAERIPWYDLIDNGINELIENKDDEENGRHHTQNDSNLKNSKFD